MLLQQLGRGLRLAKGKRKLLVLDFMDNIAKVQEYIREGFKETNRKVRPTRKSKKIKQEEEIIELLDTRGLIEAGEDISLFPYSAPEEESEEMMSPFIPPKPPPKLPTPDDDQKKVIARVKSKIDRTKKEIVRLWSLPLEDRPYIPQIGKKVGWDMYNNVNHL